MSLQNNKLIDTTDINHSYRITPIIVTFCGGNMSPIDIENFIEAGLRIIRFKMTKLSRENKINLLNSFKNAIQLFCEKFKVKSWPIAVCVDLPNAVINTGCFAEDLTYPVHIEEKSTVELTSNVKYWNKCDKNRIYMDDPYTFKSIKPGTEITIACGKVAMICKEVIDDMTIKCEVIYGGTIGNIEFLCIRGVVHTKPAISKYDLSVIEFAKEFALDVIILNSVRKRAALLKVKKLFGKGPLPKIISTICEQEGLDNIDSIIEESDAIILAREFLTYEIINVNQMSAIQLQVGYKCKQRGKPFFISGNILERSLSRGVILNSDMANITNAALEGAGFMLRDLNDPADTLMSLNILNSLYLSIESTKKEADFWRILDEIPVNAAVACVLGCAIAAKNTNSQVIIVTTVNGWTAKKLSHIIASDTVILAITCDASVARKLLIYKGVIPIIYEEQDKGSFDKYMNARIEYAVTYAINKNILKYKNTYVVLRRSSMYSSFADNLSIRVVETHKSKVISECPPPKYDEI